MGKQIKDMELKTGVGGDEDILIQDNGVTKRLKAKELMDNGLAKNTVKTEHIMPNQITPSTTNFFDIINHLPLASLEIVSGYLNSEGRFMSNADSKSMVLKVEPDTKYILKFKLLEMNRGNVVGNSDNNFTLGNTYTLMNCSYDVHTGELNFTTTSGINHVMVYFYVGTEYSVEYFKNNTDNIALYKKKVPDYDHDTINKNFLPCDIVYETSDFSSLIKNGDVIPEKTSFFKVPNLIQWHDTIKHSAILNTKGLFTKSTEGVVFVFPVEPSTHYVVKIPSNSNRYYFISNNSREFVSGTTYTLLNVTPANYSNLLYEFTTDSNTRYVASYCYKGTNPETIDINEYELCTSIYEIGLTPKLKSDYFTTAAHCMDKKILTMGDSITAIGPTSSYYDRSWKKYFTEIIIPHKLVSTAVPGATWRDKDNTIYDGSPVSNGADNNVNNVLGNQTEKIRIAKSTNDPDYDYFDIIIIAAGTNDDDNTVPSLEVIEGSFYENNNPITDLNLLDRTTWAGAIRYTVDNLRNLYPNAKIFLCTPIQKTGNKYLDIYNKRNIIKNIAERLSVGVIDTSVCGVYDLTCPSRGQEGDYNDGLHLSPQGAKKMGEFIANEIKNKYH